jgi:hypothetical protein
LACSIGLVFGDVRGPEGSESVEHALNIPLGHHFALLNPGDPALIESGFFSNYSLREVCSTPNLRDSRGCLPGRNR